MDGDSCIVIQSAGSGEHLAKLDSDEFAALAERHGTSSVRALKELFAPRLQISRFRQRLLNQETGELLQDDPKSTDEHPACEVGVFAMAGVKRSSLTRRLVG